MHCEELACAVIKQAIDDLKPPEKPIKRKNSRIEYEENKRTAYDFLFENNRLENFLTSYTLPLNPNYIRKMAKNAI